MRRAQSFVEYTLLVAVALVGLLLTMNLFLKGTISNSFSRHFDTVKGRIGG